MTMRPAAAPVLLVERGAAGRDAVAAALSAAGIPVRPARSAEEAAEALRAGEVAIAVADAAATPVDADAGRRIRELQELSAMFVAALGHDLRGPLQSVELGAQVVLGKLDDRDTVERMALTVQRASRRMAEMIDQLVCFARVRLQGAVEVLPTALDAAELVQAAIADLDGPAAARVAVDTTGDTRVTWDRDRMGQVIGNLLRNAVRHGAEDRPIAVVVEGRAADLVVLTVRNDGHVAPETLPTLLDPSARASRARGRGLGLGLYVVDRIVDAHGGTMRIASSPAAGTEVRIELPRHVPARAAGVSPA